MEISPAEFEVCDPDEAPTEVVINEEDVDICRICQSPEEPENPLNHPCACRGSLKYVHPDCLLLWINRRKGKHCEICKRSYSFVPVYSENAPERLSCHEFVVGLLVRALRFMNLILPWVLVLPFNAYLFSLTGFEKQRDYKLSWIFRGLLYTAEIMCDITCMVLMRVMLEVLVRIHPELLQRMIFIENGLRSRDVTGILLLLATYLHILCDWWNDQLLKLPFFHIFERGPFALAFVPRNTRFTDFGAIRKFFFFLDDNTFSVLAINILMSFFDHILPFLLGRVVLMLLHCFSLGWIGENVSEVTVGHTVVFAYLASVFRLPRNINPARVRWFSVFVKNTFVLCFKFGFLPWILGCWLDFCAFPITGKTLSDDPLIFAKPWDVGIVYLLVALCCMAHIQKMVQKRVFWCLLDVTEANYKITKLHLRPILFAFAFHGAVGVILLHLPIKTITLLSPSFFPLQLGFHEDEFVLSLLVAYIIVIRFGPWRLGNQNLRVRLRFLVFGIAEGSMVTLHGSQNNTEDTIDQREKVESFRFMLRTGVMLVLAAVSMFLVSTILIALPILVGRMFLQSISFFMLSFGLKHDDLCAYWIGFCILGGVYIITCFVYDHIQTGKTDLLLSHVLLCIRNVLLFSIWISVIPGLLGLLIDLMIIVPSRVPLDESPVHFLPHDWFYGVVFLHVWIFLTMLTRINCFATVAWQGKLKRISSVGINQLPFKWLIRDVIGSAVNTLLISLCVPYVVVISLFLVLGFSGVTVQRFTWPAVLALIFVWFSAELVRDIIIYLHRVEFDRRYKVGERLINFTKQLSKPVE